MGRQTEASVFVYVVARDFGFAPNPFFGFCTLACCKPKIRSAAQIGDWVFGIAGGKLAGLHHCIFGMRVTEAMTFDAYWTDPRFACKKPVRNGSRATMLGDNIYHRAEGSDEWEQEDSHHSRPDGLPEPSNVERDKSANRVLISDNFLYLGKLARSVPDRVVETIQYENRLGHRRYTQTEAELLLEWFDAVGRSTNGAVVADPIQFRQSSARFSAGSNKIIDEALEPMTF